MDDTNAVVNGTATPEDARRAIGIRTAQLIDEVDHAMVGKPRSEWSTELEALYVKALEHAHINDRINARGEECSKDECVYEYPLKLVREGLCST